MKKKAKLGLSRTTIQQLSSTQASDVRGGWNPFKTIACATTKCASANCPSMFDSCYNTDCCLEIP